MIARGTQWTTRSLIRVSQFFSQARSTQRDAFQGGFDAQSTGQARDVDKERESSSKTHGFAKGASRGPFSIKDHWIQRPAHLDEYEDEVSDFVCSLDAKELDIYSQQLQLSSQQVQLVKQVLEGHGNRLVGEDTRSLLSCLMHIRDLGVLPRQHLVRLAKWIGTSMARKTLHYMARTTFMEIYFSLFRSKHLPIVLGMQDCKTDMDFNNPEYDPITSDVDCEELCRQHPKLLKVLGKKIEQIFYRDQGGRSVPDPSGFYEFMDLIVAMSNLNTYRFEAYQTAKLLLWYAITHLPHVAHIHEAISLKATNFYWAFTRVRVPDTAFNSKFLLFYTQRYQQRHTNRQFNLLYCLSLELVLKQAYFFASATDTQLLIEGMLGMLDRMKPGPEYEPRRIIHNAKYSVMFGQLAMSLFPELAGYFRGTKELVDCAPDQNNPFHPHFYWMVERMVTSVWIAKANLLAKKAKGDPSMLIIESEDRTLQISRTSSFQQLLLYQNKIVVELRKVPEVKKLETDMFSGVYEIDILINDEYVLEVDSNLHFVQCKRQLPTISSFLKKHHLRLMGYKNVISVGQRDRELQARVYNSPKFFENLVTRLLSGEPEDNHSANTSR